MSETDYQYECMRAELLGLPKPEKEDFLTKSNATNQIEDDLIEEVPIEELDVQGEQMKNVSGGLDEINSILQTTQKKINRFKVVFGSVTSLLKSRVSTGESSETSSIAGDKSDTTGLNPQDSQSTGALSGAEQSSMETNDQVKQLPIKSPKSMDVAGMVGSHISTLDSMIYKADEINAKMNAQNKEMRRYINK